MKRFILLLAFLALLPLVANAQTVLWTKVLPDTGAYHSKAYCAKFLPNDSTILIGVYPNTILVVDVLTGDILRTNMLPTYIDSNYTFDSVVSKIEITRDGLYAYIIYDDGMSLCKYDIENNDVVRSRRLNEGSMFCLIKNDSMLIFGHGAKSNEIEDNSKNLSAVDTDSLNVLCYNRYSYYYDISSIDGTSDGKSIVIYSNGKSDYTKHPTQYTKSHIGIIGMDYYNDTSYFKSFKLLTDVKGNKNAGGNVKYSPDGKHIVATFGRLLVYDVENQTEILSDTNAWVNGIRNADFINDSIIYCLSGYGGYYTININNNNRNLYLDTFGLIHAFAISNNKQYIFSGSGESFYPMVMITNPLFTEVEDTTEGQLIFIYPNPVKDNLKLDAITFDGKSTFSLYDIQSRDMTKYLNNQTPNISQSTSLDVSKLPAGVYFLKIGNSRNSKTVKFVKE